ncbi:galectin-8-like [Saccoglossus kowalevskii]|uniref:Galectin n=1 Tax=Saccoglossus kowalevskii TaxID=10224 RepID=A0ABM0LXN9_SACKO|nr:PREDICTED: galectin-9-like [Saccoglossus kowalevskii]
MAYPSPAGWNPAMGGGGCGAYPTPGAAYPQMCYPQPGATKPILNPSIPFLGQIPGCMRPGKMVVIQGSVPPNADRFAINFQIGASTKPRADIAFHFAARVKAGHIVRNTLTNEKWGAEERGVLYQPFVPGQNFEIMILANKEEFKVAVNGQHYVAYKHRVRPLKKIDYLAINGDVRITSVKFQDEQVAAGGTHVSAAPIGPIVNPSTPYIGAIPNGMFPGKMVIINGTAPPNPTRFGVHLQIGHNQDKSHDIAFRFNPRFPANAIICNTRHGKKWGPEEKTAPYFPFQANTNFEIIILCQNDCYKVAVNGRHLLEYRHRIAYQQVNTLHVCGDVRINQIRYQ